MKFKIDTEKKLITLLGEVRYGELMRFMESFIGDDAKEWQVAFEPTAITNQIINPVNIPIQVWPYTPVEPITPYPTYPVWCGVVDETPSGEIKLDSTVHYEYPSN